MKKGYTKLATVNMLLGLVAVCLYLPYTLDAFNMPGFDWFKFVPKLLKDSYFDVLVYFGVFLIVWFIALNLISILSHINLPKLLFKVSIISALILPLIYVLAFKNETALEFWLKNIAKNAKMISYVLLGISIGSFVLGVIYNITRKNRANLHHITEAFTMCLLLLLMALCFGWCGWDFDVSYKIYGIMVGLFAIYLPISSVILYMCRNKRS